MVEDLPTTSLKALIADSSPGIVRVMILRERERERELFWGWRGRGLNSGSLSKSTGRAGMPRAVASEG